VGGTLFLISSSVNVSLNAAVVKGKLKNEGGKMKQVLLESTQAFVLHPSFIVDFVERETRLELATLALARRCSTTELLPLSKRIAFLKVVGRNVPLFLPLCPEALFPLCS
jgi:hypothetical protein